MGDNQLHEIIELEQKGYRATAVKRLKTYLHEHPQSAEGWYYLARFQIEPAQQKRALERALALRPDYPDAADFHLALLQEYPYLAHQRARRLVVILAGVVILSLGVSAALFLPNLLQDDPPEVVVVVPTTETLPTMTPETIIISPSLAPTQFTLIPPTPTADPNLTEVVATIPAIVSLTPSPTSTPVPHPEDSGITVLIAPLTEQGGWAETFLVQAQNQFPNRSAFKIAADSLTTADAIQQNAALVIIPAATSDGIQLTLYGQDMPPLYRDDPALLGLSRWGSPWEMTLASVEDEATLQFLWGVVAYISYEHQTVIGALGEHFAKPRSELDENQTALAFMLAYSYQAIGDYDNAMRLYDLLTTYTDTLNPAIAANRAYAIAQTGNYESGITLYLNLLDQHPDPAFIQSNIGDIYLTLGNNPNAAQLAYEDALRLNPQAPRPYIGRGRLWITQNQYNRALEDFTAAITLDATYALPYYERALARVQLKQWSEALADIEQALILQPALGSYSALQGLILLQDGDSSGAVTALELALSNGAQTAPVYADLARAYYELGNLDGAIQASSTALDLDPNTPSAWLARGRAHLGQDDPESAINDFTLGLTYDPRSVDLLVARCTAYARAGDDGNAATDCDSALALDGVNGWALEQRGLIRQRAGDREGAAADFQEAVLYEPTAYESHYFLGLFALQERRYNDAVESLNRAIEQAPFLGKAYAARGIAYRILGAWELAIADLEEAVNLLPEEVYSYYELGIAKRALADQAYEANNIAQARTLYIDAEGAFLAFLNGSQPTDEFVPAATQGLNYVRNALQVIGGN